MGRFGIFLSVFLATVGCHKSRPGVAVVSISLKNSSTHDLDWVKLDWEGPYVPGGILPAGISSTAVGASWPGVSKAKITFVDKKTRAPYELEVSFASVNERIHSGRCPDVTIRILDYGKADVVCESPD